MDSYARPLFWNVSHVSEIVLYVLIVVTIGVFLAGFWWRVRKWWIGQAEPDSPSVVARLRSLLSVALLTELAENILLQWRLKRDNLPP